MIDVEIKIKDNQSEFELGETLEAIVILRPQQDIGINSFRYQISVEGRGSTHSIKNVMKTVYLTRNQNLTTGEEYIYHIKWKVNIETYNGKNIDFYCYIETVIDFDEETDQIVKKDAMRQLNLFKVIYPEINTGKRCYIKTICTEPKYEMSNEGEQTNISIKGGKSIPFIGFIVIFISIQFPLMFFISFSLLFMVILYFFLPYFFLQTIYISTKHIDEENFEVMAQIENKSNMINNATFHYEIIEKVIDNRGSSSSTYRYKIADSTKEIASKEENTFKTIFSYPENNFPTTIDYQNASIDWNILFKIKFLGIPYTYTKKMALTKHL